MSYLPVFYSCLIPPSGILFFLASLLPRVLLNNSYLAMTTKAPLKIYVNMNPTSNLSKLGYFVVFSYYDRKTHADELSEIRANYILLAMQADRVTVSHNVYVVHIAIAYGGWDDQ